MKTQTKSSLNHFRIFSAASVCQRSRTIGGLAVLFASLLLGGPGRAAQIVWTNTAGGNWSGTANWSPNQMPLSADTAVITNDGNYTVTMDVNPTIAGLVVGATTGVNTQTLLVNGQTLTLNGQVTVNSQGLFNFTSGTLDGAAILAGTMTCSGGTINAGASLTVAANGVLNLTGAQSIAGPLTNNGTVNWQSGNMNVYYYTPYGYYGGIWNQAGAQWNIQCDQTLNGNPGNLYNNSTFNSAGTLTKSGTSGTTTISALLNNTGPVQAQSGTILFNQGGNLAGNFQTAAGTAINFAGNLTLTGPMTIANLVDSGATISGLSYLAGNASLTNCTINDAVTITTTLNWSGGTVNNPGGSLTVAANGVLNLTGNQDILGPLTNNGTVNWQGGNLYVGYYPGNGYYGGIWNQAGAQWNIQCDQTLSDPWYLLPTFNSAGTLTKSGTSGTTTISALLNNTGPVQAQSGTILFNQGGNLAGNFQTAAGTAINFAGNLTLTGPMTIANLVDSGATISGLSYLAGNASLTNCTINDAVTITTTLNWSGGTVNNPGGSLTVAANGVLNLTGNQDILGPLTNNGTVNWQGGNLYVGYYPGNGYYGGIWNQAGAQWNIQCDQTLLDPWYLLPTFNNAGTLTKSGTSGTTTITALLNNSGILDSESGVISLNGGFNLAGGTLNFGISGAASFGRINLAGAAALTGTLSASLNNGFVPIRGNSFAVLNYGSQSGNFGDFTLPAREAWSTNYGATTFTLTVLNSAPALPAQTNQVVNEETTLTVTNTATDLDLPPDTLSYTFLAAPSGAQLSAAGVITWTPDESQGPGTNTFTTRVADNGSPSLSATNSFQVIVNEVNVAPLLTMPENQTINELTFYTNNATATDADIPANTLTFALVSGPTNMTVSPNGGISWTPSEAQGPSTNVVQIEVTDYNPWAVNAQHLSVTNSFAITVNEVNTAPVLGALGDRTVNPGQTISFTATATDADLPTNTLTFSLIAPPASASVDSSSGLFNWRPSVSQANTTNTVQVQVTDFNPYAVNSQHLSDTKSFTVIVNPLAPVVLTPMGYANGQFSMSVTGSVGPDYVLQGSATLTNWVSLVTNTPGSMPFIFTDPAAGAFSNRFYRAKQQP